MEVNYLHEMESINQKCFNIMQTKECQSQSASHSGLSGSVNSPVLKYAVSECKSYINQQERYPLRLFDPRSRKDQMKMAEIAPPSKIGNHQ